MERYEYIMHMECAAGRHHWSPWGPFEAAFDALPERYVTFDIKNEPVEFKAFRWRHCRCGAAQRESYSGEQKVFNPS